MKHIETKYSYAIYQFVCTYTNNINDKTKRYLPEDEYSYWFKHFYYEVEDVILDRDDIIHIVERKIELTYKL